MYGKECHSNDLTDSIARSRPITDNVLTDSIALSRPITDHDLTDSIALSRPITDHDHTANIDMIRTTIDNDLQKLFNHSKTQKCYLYQVIPIWNSLPNSLKNCTSKFTFKKQIKSHLLSS